MKDDWTLIDGKWTEDREEKFSSYEITINNDQIRIRKLKPFAGPDYDEITKEEARELMNNLRRILG